MVAESDWLKSGGNNPYCLHAVHVQCNKETLFSNENIALDEGKASREPRAGAGAAAQGWLEQGLARRPRRSHAGTWGVAHWRPGLGLERLRLTF